MSTSGVAVLDHTVQETNVWLRIVAEQLHFEDRHHAYIALRAVCMRYATGCLQRSRCISALSFRYWCAASTMKAGIWLESR